MIVELNRIGPAKYFLTLYFAKDHKEYCEKLASAYVTELSRNGLVDVQLGEVMEDEE